MVQRQNKSKPGLVLQIRTRIEHIFTMESTGIFVAHQQYRSDSFIMGVWLCSLKHGGLRSLFLFISLSPYEKNLKMKALLIRILNPLPVLRESMSNYQDISVCILLKWRKEMGVLERKIFRLLFKVLTGLRIKLT